MSLSRKHMSARRLSAVGLATTAAVVVTGAGVYAVLSATASNTTPQTATSGTLKLTLADSGSAGFASAVANLVPGQAAHRYVALTNGGSLAASGLKLSVADGTPSKLSTDAAEGLQVTVTSCTAAWTTADGTCSGTAAVELTSPLAALGTAQAFADGTMAAGEVKHLKVSVALPDKDEVTVNGVLPAGTVQGLSAALTWTFAETQQV